MKPNLFIALEIDPNAPWNQAHFESQLTAKTREWARLSSGVGSKAKEAKQYMGYIDYFKRVAGNEEARNEEAAEARQLLDEQKKVRRAEFDQHIELWKLKGYFLEAEVRYLIKEFADIFSEGEIRKKAKPVDTKKEKKTARPPVLDGSKAKTIQEKLDQLGKKDLYDLLQANERTSQTELINIVKTLNDHVQKMPAKDRQLAIIQELCGICLDVFKSDEDKAKYDETLRQREYNSLKKQVHLLGKFSKTLESVQINHLLEFAKQKKLDLSLAEEVILEQATKSKYRVIMPKPVQELQQHKQLPQDTRRESASKIYGIDLGMTHSCIAHVDGFGKAVIIQNAEGDMKTPSVVYFESPGNQVVGKEAKNVAEIYPKQVVEMVKQQMGQPDWMFHYKGTNYSAEEITSYILRKVVQDAEVYLDCKIKDVVITCPVYFGINEREAIANAGRIAGLNVRTIINEPIAAFLAYNLHAGQSLAKQPDQIALIYHLGDSSFNITMVEKKGNELTVIATGGHRHLGGKDWDKAVVDYLAHQWQELTGNMNDPRDDPESAQDLFLKAETAKQLLSRKEKTEMAVIHASQRKRITLTREKFDELTSSLLEQTIQYTKVMLYEATKKGYHHFDQILLVGGSTRMPQVTKRLQQEFNIEPHIQHAPDLVVAKGAALFYMVNQEDAVETTAVEAGDTMIAQFDDFKKTRQKPSSVEDLSGVPVYGSDDFKPSEQEQQKS